MNTQHSVPSDSGRKRKIRIIAGLFFGLLMGLTLLSNTLMSLTLPKVAVTEPTRGQLVHMYQGGGSLHWKAAADLTGSMGWKVEQVAVKEGEAVKKGQTLVIFDSAEAQQRILDEKAGLGKLMIAIEELQSKYIEAAHSGEETNMTGARRDLKLGKIDLEVQQRRILKLEKDLTANRRLIAPFDGIVMEINAVEGLVSSTGGPDVRIANEKSGLVLELAVPADAAAALNIGDTLDVQVVGSDARQVEGLVADIQDSVDKAAIGEGGGTASTSDAPMNRILVSIHDEGLTEGRRVRVELTNAAYDDALLLSNQAIREDGSGKYVYLLEERSGPLGNAYYIRRASILVADADDNVSAVTLGVYEHDQVILESSQPLQDGDKVRMQ